MAKNTEKMEKIIDEMENPKNPDDPKGLHKFRDTAIYHSFRYALSGQQQATEKVEFIYDLIYQTST